ncbi:MAG: DMT family transporter [candidate division Zixibacteria bacterium]|nr:DMT family transporter [candidate division Zixibacteria bacterium]
MNSGGEHQRSQHILLLSFGALCVSFAAIFVKLLGGDVMGPTAIGFWRTLFGAAILFGWAVSRRSKLAPAGPVLKWLVVAGFIFFLDLFLWHRSIIYSGAGMATILANTQVFATAILSFFIFKEKLGIKFLAAVLTAVIGVVLLVGVGSDFELTALYLRGVVFGLLTGLVYAHYLVTIKFAGQRQQSTDFIVLMAWTSLFSALFLGGSAAIEGDLLLPPDWLSLFILFSLALVAQALGWWAIATSLSKIEASRSSLILLLQPVLATVWGVLFFSEHLTWMQLAGAVMTLGAIYVGSIRRTVPPVPAE